MNGENLQVVYNNFLSDKECDEFTSLSLKWNKGLTASSSYQDIRIVNSVDITAQYWWLDEKVFSFINNVNINYGYDISHVNESKLLKYDIGGKYDWHQDVLWGNKAHRKFTFIIQLSDDKDYEGGQFEFRDTADSGTDLSTFGKKGSILVFPSILYHRITPLTKGNRYSIVGWVIGNRWK